MYPMKIFLKTDMIPCLVKQFLEASRQNKRAEFTESRKRFKYVARKRGL